MDSIKLNCSWMKENTPSMFVKSMFYYVQSSGHFYCEPDYIVDRKDFDTKLLVYTVKGTGYLKYREKLYTLTSGQVFLIDCMDYQCYKTDNNNLWEMLWVHFNGSESKGYVEQILKNGGPVYTLDNISTVKDNIQKIHDMMLKNDKRVNIISSCLIVEILTELLLISSHGNQVSSNIPEVIEDILQKIENSYFQNVSMDSLAKSVGVSKYHLSRLFKKYTNYSPYEYLIKCRMDKAKSLLKTTNMPVYEISEKVGFESTSHFIKTFRKNEEITPLKYRNYWK